MILDHHAFVCEHTRSANVFKMYKKCLFFICAVFVLEVKSDCDGYVECFNSFFTNFFSQSETNVEYVNATSKNLPENFVEVKDVQFGDISKVLSEISSFIQQDIEEQLKTQSQDVVFENVNPKTKVYVKTFTYNNAGNVLLPDLENIAVKEESITEKNKEEVENEETSSLFIATPHTTIKSDELKIIEKQKDISENEIPQSDDIHHISYYDSVEDNSTDYPIIDYVELYKDTTNEENVYNPTENPTTDDIRDHIQEKIVEYVDHMEKFIEDINNSTDDATDVSSVFPWISTIFLKNDSKSNQFEYYCDGALLNERLLITAASCVTLANSTVDSDSLLVILGKRSLLSMADKEHAVKIKQVITHEKFTSESGKVENDLALLVLETPVVFNEIIQPATIGNNTEDVDKYFTSAWNLQGDIVPVALEGKEALACNDKNIGEHIVCASYGLSVALCPSYGGIFAGYQAESWRLYGIRSGDTSDRGICFDKNVAYTDLSAYEDWIAEHFE